MHKKIGRSIIAALGVFSVLTLSMPLHSYAQPYQKPYARFLNDNEIRVDYPEWGAEYRMKKTDTAAYRASIIVQKGLLGAKNDCGAQLFTLAFINATSISISAQGLAQNLAGAGGQNYPACDSTVTSNLAAQNISIDSTNSTKPQPDAPGTDVIAAVVIIPNNQGLTDAGANFIDLNKAPEKDTITVNDLSLTGPANQIKTAQASRELSGADVVYRANFDGIKPGNYEVCSKEIIKKCERFTKEGGQILNASLVADKTKFDIVKKDAGTSNENDKPKSCQEEFGISTGWIVCDLLEFVSSTIDKLFDAVDSLLSVDALALSSNTGLRTSWSYFRGIATFSLLAIGLVMVLSQAIGGGKR